MSVNGLSGISLGLTNGANSNSLQVDGATISSSQQLIVGEGASTNNSLGVSGGGTLTSSNAWIGYSSGAGLASASNSAVIT